MRRPPIQQIYRYLHTAWGPRGWWPADSDLEMMVGAILTQNTAWTNVEKAIERLNQAGALRFRRLHEAPIDEVATVFTRSLPHRAPLFNQYHALIVELGKNHCRVRPDCASCPLRSLLPRGGPVGDQDIP